MQSEIGSAGRTTTSTCLTGGTGQASHTPDERITDVEQLPAGPFQLTNGRTFKYSAYAASPVHRFYQMWQQLNCSPERSSADNPSGCNGQLFSWVEVTVGAGTNGAAQPQNFSTEYAPDAVDDGRRLDRTRFLQRAAGRCRRTSRASPTNMR